jgi:hypothetical protein
MEVTVRMHQILKVFYMVKFSFKFASSFTRAPANVTFLNMMSNMFSGSIKYWKGVR